MEIIRPSLNIGGEIPGGVSISAVLGLALDTSRQRINFVLPEVQIRKTLKERSRDLILLGSLLMFILALSGGIFLAKVSNRTGYLKLLDQRFGEIRKNVEELDSMAKKIRIIRERLNTRILSLDYLYQIHKLIPAEITLKMITLEADDKTTLRGQAQTMSDAFKFIDILKNSAYFKDIQTKYTSKKRVAERDVSEFEIICPMVIGKK